MESGPLNELIEETVRLLGSRGLEPKVIPRGSVRELLGGLACMDLDKGENIESALLLARGRAPDPESKYILNLEAGVNIDSALLLAGGNMEEAEQRLLCRIDYAVRGDIRGIRPWRRIISLRAVREGLFRKKIKDHAWAVPREQDSRHSHALTVDGALPGPGEVWEGGPHQVLAGLLNGDEGLMDSVKALAVRHGIVNPLLNVFSDRWGESIRVSSGIWVKADDLTAVHASGLYLEAVNLVCGHLRETRRRFGGLTF